MFLESQNSKLKNTLSVAPEVELTDSKVEWVLFYDSQHRLSLTHVEEAQLKPMVIDFQSSNNQSKVQSLRSSPQPLLKALGSNPERSKTVWDLTAGFGTDAFLIHSSGFSVLMLEENPLVFVLLQDAVSRWRQDMDSALSFEIQHKDSLCFLREDSVDTPDVIYLDPMFPQKKKGRLSRGPMQWMQKILHDSEAPKGEELLSLSLQTAKDRVVVKRGLKDPTLQGPLVHSYKGSSVRYDMYKSP